MARLALGGSAISHMTHTFLGLSADEWEQADPLPNWSPMTNGPVTIEDVKAGIVAMLRRQEWRCEECGEPWNPLPDSPDQCRRCGNRTRTNR